MDAQATSRSLSSKVLTIKGYTTPELIDTTFMSVVSGRGDSSNVYSCYAGPRSAAGATDGD